jgi:hypothetical protein
MRTFSANESSVVVSVFFIDRRYSFSGSGFWVQRFRVQRLKSLGLLVSGSRKGLPYFGGFWLTSTFRNPQSEIYNHLDLSSVN